ncbi:MAG: hypothetical protein AAB424_04100 [Patescibacteria group bacterium]
MVDQDLQNFYNDRRKRGLSDKIIFNELEASGWSKEGLQERIAAAKFVFEKSPTADFMADGSTIEYDITQQHKQKVYMHILYACFSVVAFVFFTIQESHDWLVVGINIAAFTSAGVFFIVKNIVKVRSYPQRIRYDSQGLTILKPPGQIQRWTTFTGFRALEQGLTEEDMHDHPVTFSFFSFKKIKPPTRPVLQLYRIKHWVGLQSKALAYTLPLPPGREASVVALVSKYLPALSSNDATNGTSLAWKIFTIGMGFLALFLIGAIILVLVY